jgi:hypothetical protein
MLAAVLAVGALACQTTDQFIALATATRTRTPRPTLTPLPINTDTPTPSPTLRATATFTPTLRPPTARPATAKPPTAPPKPIVQQPTVSNMEFHVNPPTCSHSGMTFIKGTVYLNKNDPSQRYEGAIVALGPPDGSTIYAVVKSEWDGTYTHILGDPGQARPGNWGVWLVTPSMVRKSDIGGPIVTNGLGPDDPKACWAGSVDFWK